MRRKRVRIRGVKTRETPRERDLLHGPHDYNRVFVINHPKQELIMADEASTKDVKAELSKHLARRPSPSELEDTLAHKVTQRLTKSELEAKNILKQDTNLSGALHAAANELEKARLCDAVEQQLKRRVSPEELEAKGIIKT
ncbi:hypothetical protein SeMB42_g02418 [Synchytrium endobioticum]|uniref:Uncharacterized protein n=1 Tax=Synchytrium endobioticum TaxID=286115 RepID=A0A507DE57_9FUNG|nr:hypothetical protein SeMB42_g02418 [Synchytrium endobioticum]